MWYRKNLAVRTQNYELLWNALLAKQYDTYLETPNSDRSVWNRNAFEVIKLRGNARWLFRQESAFDRVLLVNLIQQQDANCLKEPRKSYLVSGDALSGRTSFLNYLLVRYAQDRQHVTIHNADDRQMCFLKPSGEVHVEADYDYVNRFKKLDPNAILLGKYIRRGIPLTSYIKFEGQTNITFVQSNSPYIRYIHEVNNIHAFAAAPCLFPLMWNVNELIAAAKYADPPVDESLVLEMYDVRKLFQLKT